MTDGYQPVKNPVHELADKPPYATEALEELLSKRRLTSANMPHGALEAAQWWVQLQEPADEWGEKVSSLKKDGKVVGWQLPYHNRLVYTLRIFLLLSETEKAFVVNAMERGIPWRGDGILMFREICRQHEIMKRNPEIYITEAVKKLAGFRLPTGSADEFQEVAKCAQR